MTNEPRVGMWDFDAACMFRDGTGSAPGQITFSVSCFQWVPTARGDGLKRGKVQYRVKGYCSDPEPAFRKAEEYCRRKNEHRILSAMTRALED